MADEKSKYAVVHPKLNLRVDGKLQRVAVGTELLISEAQAKRYGKKVMKVGKKKSIEVSASR